MNAKFDPETNYSVSLQKLTSIIVKALEYFRDASISVCIIGNHDLTLRRFSLTSHIVCILQTAVHRLAPAWEELTFHFKIITLPVTLSAISVSLVLF